MRRQCGMERFNGWAVLAVLIICITIIIVTGNMEPLLKLLNRLP